MVTAVVFEFSVMRCQPLRRALCLLSGLPQPFITEQYATKWLSVRISLIWIAQAATQLCKRKL
ncbi:hypothetical protein B4935_18610 [Vibrio cholerae]|nr:hypothetical protein [Vibrio cholerae]MCD1235103.1 hypothetical protein [Vibrio cholerae]MCD1242370.1 hypothetical protein [Vibrio cholerae]MCD1257088.1 hypothetical protein [Vibrio cholerae]